jgi:hypothetical protein
VLVSWLRCLTPCAWVPFVKLRLSILHFLITVAYFGLRQLCPTLKLPLPLVCDHNTTTFVTTLRIGWFINAFTLQTICQWRQPLGSVVEVCFRPPSNIWCRCCDCGFWPVFLNSLCEALSFLTGFYKNNGIFSFPWVQFHFNSASPLCVCVIIAK